MSKIINCFCSKSLPKLTPGYSTDYYFHFISTPAKSNDPISLKVQKPFFFNFFTAYFS